MPSRALPFLIVLLALLGGGTVEAGENATEAWADGSPKVRYELDEEGRKHGTYTRWHESGSVAETAHYEKDQLHGLWRSFDASGTQRSAWTYRRGLLHGSHKTYDAKGRLRSHRTYRHGTPHGSWKDYHENKQLKVTASYRDGQLHGNYHVRANDGSSLIKSRYKQGLLNGSFRAFEGKRTVSKQSWKMGIPMDVDGILPYPRRAEELVSALQRVLRGDGELSHDTLKADRELALRYLKAYRCLSGVPYEDIAVNPNYEAHAQAASAVCRDLGHITHFPENPGWEEARFQFAAMGTKSSNLAQGRIACESVRAYMDDSDARNIAKVGHRAWCMNPAMTETGFGTVDRFSAMWSISKGRRKVFDYEFVACPPPGHSPGQWFGTHWAWSVSLNPKTFDAPEGAQLKVRVVPVGETFLPLGPALVLNHLSVLKKSAGIPFMVVFRPVGYTLTSASRYRVTVEGLTAKGKPKVLTYYVAFFDFAYPKPAVPSGKGTVLSR